MAFNWQLNVKRDWYIIYIIAHKILHPRVRNESLITINMWFTYWVTKRFPSALPCTWCTHTILQVLPVIFKNLLPTFLVFYKVMSIRYEEDLKVSSHPPGPWAVCFPSGLAMWKHTFVLELLFLVLKWIQTVFSGSAWTNIKQLHCTLTPASKCMMHSFIWYYQRKLRK